MYSFKRSGIFFSILFLLNIPTFNTTNIPTFARAEDNKQFIERTFFIMPVENIKNKNRTSDWKALAKSMSQRTGCPVDILLATVEAETYGKNELGDSGNACGYGQVWYKWHADNFRSAASLLGISLPTSYSDIQDLTLKNDEFSMAVAAYCIKQYWTSTHHNWSDFTHAYVGAGIPDADFNRRKKIWDSYAGTTGGYIGPWTGTVSKTADTGGTIGSTVNANTPPEIDPNIYQVAGPATQTGQVLYGRKYRILIGVGNETALDVSQLWCTFNIIKTMNMQPGMSEVTIYNLNAETENAIIKEGMRVIVEAGYEGDQYGVIYNGEIVQPIRDKIDGTTYKLTLTAQDGDRFINAGFINFAQTRGLKPRQFIESCASNAKNPVELGSISDTLTNSQLTRGKSVFGLARDYLRQIARSEQANFYMEDGKINLIKMSDMPAGEVIDLSPQSGLIDVPAQNEFGITGKALLNPRIKTNTLVHIDNSIIRIQRRELGQILRTLDQDGLYRVIKCNYIGDTRGNEWYVEFEAITQIGQLPGMVTNGLANPN